MYLSYISVLLLHNLKFFVIIYIVNKFLERDMFIAVCDDNPIDREIIVMMLHDFAALHHSP